MLRPSEWLMANSKSQMADSDTPSAIGYRLCATGVVQGVGFRPFVYGLATRLDLKGWVCNTSSGVVIEIEGCPEAIDEFRTRPDARHAASSAHRSTRR